MSAARNIEQLRASYVALVRNKLALATPLERPLALSAIDLGITLGAELAVLRIAMLDNNELLRTLPLESIIAEIRRETDAGKANVRTP